MKLHLLLVLLAGMSALAAALEPRDFEFLEMQDDPDDINADHMSANRSAAIEAMRDMTNLARSSASSASALLMQRQRVQGAAGDVPLPPGYLMAMEDGMPMFNGFRAQDVPWNNVLAINPTTPPPTTTTRRPIFNQQEAAAELAPSADREKRSVPTTLYYCPHRNFLLTWFQGSQGRICFVPWAWNQRITYARCTARTCNIRKGRQGRCRPSCFERRYIFVLCFSHRGWQWRWELKNLPQACRCSTC